MVRRFSREIPWLTHSTDPDLRLLFSLKSAGGDAPTYEDIRAESGFSKQMFAQWDTVEIHDGVLYRRIAVVHEILQLLVPASYKHDFLVKTHQGMTGGHLGVRRTLAQVQRRAFWLSLIHISEPTRPY